MATITSLQNPRVKDAVRLRDRRHREKQGRIVIDGARELMRAMSAGVRLVEVFVCEPRCRGDDARRVLGMLSNTGVDVLDVGEVVLEKVAFGSRVEGLVGIAEVPPTGLERLVLPESPLVAILEGVEKPGNIGAVLRSADGAGVSAVVVADPLTDVFNPNAIRASLGTIFSVPLAAAGSGQTLAWLRRQRLNLWAARVEGSVPYWQVDFRGPTAIILGSESAGLTQLWRDPSIPAVRLPMLGGADSLNVSSAAAVLFYEVLRQRTVAKGTTARGG